MKRLMPILPVLLFVFSSFGDIRFTANTDHTNVVPGEQVTITADLVCNKELRNVSPPPVASTDAFTVAGTNQTQQQSTSIQMINGKVINNSEINYIFYYVIIPKKAGGFTFPSLQVSINNTPYATAPIQFNAAAAPAKNADVRVLMSANRSTLYMGEEAMLTIKVAIRANAPAQIDDNCVRQMIGNFEKAPGKGISLSGLYQKQVGKATERIGGETYQTYNFCWIISPLNSGTINIPAASLPYAELHQARRQADDPFGDPFFGNFFGNQVQAVQRNAVSNSLTIHAKELPPPPAGFSGCIGKVNMTASISPASVAAGESATLNVMIAAATRPGNIADITAPKLAGCEIFPPEKHMQVDTTGSAISTKKAFKFLVIPSQEGPLSIPPFTLTYFDPAEGSYKTVSTQPLSITVTPGKPGAKPQTRYLTQEEIHELGTDIRYIKTDAKIRNIPEKPYHDPVFFLLYPLPFAIFFLSLLYKMQSQRRETNPASFARARALKAARKAFEGLRKKAASLPAEKFLGGIAETMEHYISQKFDFPATGRTLEELKSELLQRNANEQTVTELAKFIELLDSYRFGGATFDEKSRSAVLDQAVSFAAGLEKGAKKKAPNVSAIATMLLAALAIAVSSANAAPVNLWFEQANKFYTGQQYDSAVTYYDKIVSAGTSSPEVFFNLGNAYYRMHKLGLSRLAYEKAAKLAPADGDIKANIKYLSSNIVDRISDPEPGFIEAVFSRFHNLMPLRAQLWFCGILLLLIGALCSAALYSFGNRRLWLIYAASLLTLVLAASGTSMAVKIYDSETSAWAILIDPSVDARNEPDGAKILFSAHEGTKFQIRKTVEGWSLVSLPNGAAGWVENKMLGRI